jgi:hypothetical protein
MIDIFPGEYKFLYKQAELFHAPVLPLLLCAACGRPCISLLLGVAPLREHIHENGEKGEKRYLK